MANMKTKIKKRAFRVGDQVLITASLSQLHSMGIVLSAPDVTKRVGVVRVPRTYEPVSEVEVLYASGDIHRWPIANECLCLIPGAKRGVRCG